MLQGILPRLASRSFRLRGLICFETGLVIAACPIVFGRCFFIQLGQRDYLQKRAQWSDRAVSAWQRDETNGLAARRPSPPVMRGAPRLLSSAPAGTDMSCKSASIASSKFTCLLQDQSGTSPLRSLSRVQSRTRSSSFFTVSPCFKLFSESRTQQPQGWFRLFKP